jgi:SAM-dependent methyltransferase
MSVELVRRTGKYKPTIEDAIELSGIEMLHPGGRALTRRTAELAALSPGMHVLDVSCGRGTQSVFYARHFQVKVTGIDIAPQMVATARERVRLEGLAGQIQIDQGDSQNLPYPDDSFDVVINECAVGIPDDPRRVVSEMRRVAKPGARILIHESTWTKTLTRVAKDDIAERYGTTPLEREDWVNLLNEAGIRVEHVELERWSRPEMFWAVREDRKPSGFGDILTLSERLHTLKSVCVEYGCSALWTVYRNEAVFKKLVTEGIIGYGLYVGVKQA